MGSRMEAMLGASISKKPLIRPFNYNETLERAHLLGAIADVKRRITSIQEQLQAGEQRDIARLQAELVRLQDEEIVIREKLAPLLPQEPPQQQH